MNKALRELLEKIENKKAEGKQLLASNKLDEAKSIKNELTSLQAQFDEGLKQYDAEKARIESQYGTDPVDMGKVKLYNASQKMFNGVQNAESLNMGKYVRGLVTGDWSNAASEQKAMINNALTGGSYLVPTPLAEQLIEMVRNNSALIQAGALTTPMTSATLKIGRQIKDVKSHWKVQSELITESEPQFDAIEFNAKTLVGMVRLPVELLEDAQNLEQIVTQSLVSSLALELDRVGLVGSGTGEEPQGLYANTNIVKQKVDAAITNFAPFNKAVTAIKTNNMTPGAVIMSPRTDGQIDGLCDTTGQPLNAPKSYNDLTKVVSTQIADNLGTGKDSSLAVVGDFSKLWYGMRTNMTIEVSRTAQDAFGRLQVLVRAYLRADVKPVQDKAFVVLDAIK